MIKEITQPDGTKTTIEIESLFDDVRERWKHLFQPKELSDDETKDWEWLNEIGWKWESWGVYPVSHITDIVRLNGQSQTEIKRNDYRQSRYEIYYAVLDGNRDILIRKPIK